jgi:hypothetical protein
MADVVFRYKSPGFITAEQKATIQNDIGKGNEEAREQWKKVATTFNGRVMRYTVGWTDFAKQIAMSAEYFSAADIIKGIEFFDGRIDVAVDEAFIGMMEYGSILGIDAVRASLNWIKKKVSGVDEMNAEMFNTEGFSKYIVQAFRDNGVEAIRYE